MSFFSNTWINGASKSLVINSGGGVTPPTCWPEPIGPCSTAMQRYLWQMDGQSMYWRRESNDYGQTTNARLRVAFTGGQSSGLGYLVGRHSSDRFYIAINSENNVFFGNGSNASQGATSVDVSKINLAELVADGTDVKFYVNNVLITTQAQSWTGLLDDVGFGVRGEQQSDFYSGSIYAVAVETDNENDVYPLDGTSPYELPNGVEIGPELWVGQPSVIDASITDNGDGTYFCDGSQTSNASLRINSILSANNGYFSGLEVDGYTLVGGGTGNRVRMSVGTTFINATSDGAYSGATTTTTDTNVYITVEVGVSCTIKRVTVKALPSSALIRENNELDGSDIILIDRQTDNGGWDTVANIWEPAVKAVTGSATTPTPTSIDIDEVGNNTPLAGVQIFSSGLVGDVIRVTGNATINSGQVDVSLLNGLAGVAASITASGPFSFDLDSTGYVGFKRAFAGGADATITDIKVITVLDYADGALPELSAYTAAYSEAYGA